MGKLIITAFGYTVALSLVLCVYLVIRKHGSLRSAQQCNGSVIAHVPRVSSKGTTFALKIDYRDRQNTLHDFTTTTSTNPPARAVGDNVIVFHHPDGSAPDVLVFADLYLWYWIWFCLGICAAGCIVAPRLLNVIYLR